MHIFKTHDGVFSFVVQSDVLDYWAEVIPNQDITVSIEKSGCSGYGYAVSAIDRDTPFEPNDFYRLDLGHNVYLRVSHRDAKIFRELKCSFKQDNFNRQLLWTHKTDKMICGCGESFEISPNES